MSGKKYIFAASSWFPYGGLSRDMLRIATLCDGLGVDVELVVGNVTGEPPDGIAFSHLASKGLTNHQKTRYFSPQLNALCCTFLTTML